MTRQIMIAGGAIFLCLVAVGFLIIRGATADTAAPEARPIVEPNVEQVSIPQASLARVKEPLDSFSDGQWEVGAHILSGQYQTLDATRACYWERLSDWSGCISDVIEHGDVDGEIGVVNIAASDVGFSTEGCGTWKHISD